MSNTEKGRGREKDKRSEREGGQRQRDRLNFYPLVNKLDYQESKTHQFSQL